MRGHLKGSTILADNRVSWLLGRGGKRNQGEFNSRHFYRGMGPPHVIKKFPNYPGNVN